MSVYTTAQIMEILPHRAPFLMIDTIEELDPGTRAVGRKCVTFGEPYFTGHFPGNPVMPGVLIVEAMAQTGAVALLGEPNWRGKTAYFAGIDKVRFKKMVRPGDILTIETRILWVKGPMGKGEATACVDGQVAAKAELMFAIGE